MLQDTRTLPEVTERYQRDVIPLLPRLSGRARQLTRNPHDAEDLLQETMLLAYRGFHSFQPGTNLKAWLYQIMQNRWISQNRSRSCRPGEVFIGVFADDQTSVSDDMVSELFVDTDLRTALMALDGGVRTVVFLAYYLDLPHKDIATAMNLPVGTVMSRLHRGRTQLRKTIGA
ncbi:sigma-70 family RNA polymerase sigma factor [Mycobacterium sp. 236(2023)]|uniref:sigma-70 family RNA polymerase sigma factor n=1 Tax=Mycobacterium sp. 236(2023) TaxID=3038163 RepID=UPI00241550EC|nr:sigma-70 family RNA polymerase sigma factor [Mycobacterium sp. 236(2023)]MDG4665607.1 sigma-70 family RNA polymerase sigma factor [Mycobacterium sp. 236(2023)]